MGLHVFPILIAPPPPSPPLKFILKLFILNLEKMKKYNLKIECLY